VPVPIAIGWRVMLTGSQNMRCHAPPSWGLAPAA